MLTSILNFILEYKWIILFYLIIAVLIYINRKKFEIENKFIFLFKTKHGIDFINKFSDKNREFVKILGYSAIGLGFAGMILICGFLIKGLYELIFVPSAPATMSLVIPGVQIPGSPVFVPFWYGIIALFIVVVIHEFGHGIVARAHGLKIKSTGIVFFGPLIGAFVEPDEKTMIKKEPHIQNSIFAAGPFANMLLAGFIALILLFVLNPLLNTMVYPNGITFSNIQTGFPAETYGLITDTTYTQLNGLDIKTGEDLTKALACIKPNESIVIGNAEKNITLITTSNPSDSTKGYLGVSGVKTNYEMKSDSLIFKGIYYVLFFLINLFEWIFILSLGIGLANLLPLGPVDGGRMLGISLNNIHGKERGNRIWVNVSIMTLIIMLILIITPIIKEIFFAA